jgi:hypothetical protein
VDWASSVEREIREVDTGGDGCLAAQALLAMRHLVHAVVERDHTDVAYRIAAQQSVAVKSERVIALHLALHARALSQGDVAGREDLRHPQFPRQHFGHHAIARTRHSGIRFGDEQHVAGLQVGVPAKGFQLRLQLRAPLDVPGQKTVARARRGFLMAKVGDMRRGQRSGNQPGDGAVSRVDLHFGGRTALSQRFQAGQDLARHGGVELVLGCVVYSHLNGGRSPEIVPNLGPGAGMAAHITLPPGTPGEEFPRTVGPGEPV